MSGATATQPGRDGASAAQLRAVYAVMRILAEDDRERAGVQTQEIACAACHRDRPAAGSVDYSGARLCNGCATDYELLKIAGQVDDLAAYLAKESRSVSVAPVPGRGALPHRRGSSRR